MSITPYPKRASDGSIVGEKWKIDPFGNFVFSQDIFFRRSITLNHYSNATDKINRGDAYGAWQEIEQAIKAEPEVAALYEMRAKLFSQLNPSQALKDWNTAIQLEPNNMAFYFERARLHKKLGNLENALDDLSQAITIDPTFPFTYLMRGVIYHQLKDFDAAIADLTHVINLKLQIAVAYYDRANVFRDCGQISEALNDYNEAIRISPQGDADYYFYRGMIYFSLSRFREALFDFDQSVLLNPNDPYHYSNRGKARAALGDFEGAIQDYDLALSSEITLNDAAVILCDRADAYSQLGNIDQAIQDYRAARKHNPKNIRAIQSLAKSLALIGNWDQAIKGMKLAFQLDPTSDFIRDLLAQFYYWRAYLSFKGKHKVQISTVETNGEKVTGVDQLIAAILDCDEAIKLKPDEGLYYGLRATIYDYCGYINQPIKDYSKYLQLCGEQHVHEGTVSERLAVLTKLKAELNGIPGLNLIDIEEPDRSALSAFFLSTMGYKWLQMELAIHAIDAFQEALRYNKFQLDALIGLGDSYYFKQVFDKALACYSSVINTEIDMDNIKSVKVIAYRRRAEVRRHMGDSQGAKYDLTQAKRLEGRL